MLSRVSGGSELPENMTLKPKLTGLHLQIQLEFKLESPCLSSGLRISLSHKFYVMLKTCDHIFRDGSFLYIVFPVSMRTTQTRDAQMALSSFISSLEPWLFGSLHFPLPFGSWGLGLAAPLKSRDQARKSVLDLSSRYWHEAHLEWHLETCVAPECSTWY